MRATIILFLCFALLGGTLLSGCGSGGGTSASYSTAVNTGNATISWNPVTTYTNNDPLTPTGYRIRYGTTAGTYSTTVTVLRTALANPNAPRYTVTGLARRTRYYFVVSAYDSNNVESGLSSAVSKTIP